MSLETDDSGHNDNVPAQSQPNRILPFEFRGNGGEYFKIWIVNVLLTLITLGIYSAWATVRNNRYFYSNTFVNDVSFDYLAKPLQILKGRVIAVGLFLIIVGIASISPTLVAFIYLIFALAAPYIYNQAVAFKMRNTAYRNLQFRFYGSYGEAFKVLIAWPIGAGITAGLLYPLALRELHQYRVSKSAYGTTRFNFSASAKDYYKIFGIGVVIILCLSGIVVTLLSGLMALQGKILLGFLLSYFFAMLYFTVSLTNLVFSNLSLKEHSFSAKLTVIEYGKVMITNLVLITLTLGLYIPAAKIRMMKYMTSCMEFHAQGSLEDFVAAEKESVSALGEQLGEVFDFSA